MFSAENIVVLGAGKSGVGAAVLAQKKGKNVFVSDASSITLEYKSILNNYDIKWEENGHSDFILDKAIKHLNEAIKIQTNCNNRILA